jgi:CheY-like chemotaxis protein
VAIQVETAVEADLPDIYCNESDLREALTNLVLNSVDALPQGGTIKLSARPATLPTGPDDHRAMTHLILEVIDNGIGMDEKTRQRCLEPFFSTKRQRGGSGLGLAMVYGTVERHQGRIEIESQVNQGTTVRLILPLRQPPPPKTQAAPIPEREVSSLRILCIDDEPLLREMLKEILEFYQHEVQIADGGQTGLDAFRQAQKAGRPFDVVITDLGMPGVNGREVIEKIKAEFPKTGVIMLTGWGTMLDLKSEGLVIADAVLSKPPRVNELLAALAKVAGVPYQSDTAFVAREVLAC